MKSLGPIFSLTLTFLRYLERSMSVANGDMSEAAYPFKVYPLSFNRLTTHCFKVLIAVKVSLSLF